MTSLCFITVCMGRLAFLRQTLGRVLDQPGSSCVVVDWSCPDRAGDWVEANQARARVLRVPAQATVNVTRARNLGARLADAAWLCFIDADILLSPAFAATVVPQLVPGRYYRAAPPSEGVCGTVVCARDDFARSGGYDETFRSYGDDDFDLYDALEFAGLRAADFPAALLSHLPHGHDLRTRHFDFRERLLGNAVNRIYRVTKWALARARGRAPDAAGRGSLYEKVFRDVSAALAAAPSPYRAEALLGLVLGELRDAGVAPGAAEVERVRQALFKPLVRGGEGK